MPPGRLSYVVFVLTCLLGVIPVAGGCSGKKASQYPEDHARYQRIDDAIEGLRKAYARKDLSGFDALLLPGELRDHLQQEVRRDFEAFQEISLDLAIDRIVIEGDRIDAFVHWQGRWRQRPGDTVVRERGHGMLQWVGVEAILLSGLQGDVLFGMAGRRGLDAGMNVRS